jgi:type IV secretory pathway TrbF-like protein
MSYSSMSPSAPSSPSSLAPKTLEGARQTYLELYGDSLVTNSYLKLALLGMTIVAAGNLVLSGWMFSRTRDIKPIVVRIDEVGRATAVQYDVQTYQQPRAPEMKYFLTRFAILHFARRRATVKQDFPQSLLFLKPSLADGLMAQEQRTQDLEHFLTNTSDEIEIVVKNVTLPELTKPPYKAAIDFERVYYSVGTYLERRRETYVAQVDFVLRESIPAALIPINPLGLTILYVREDQAFR